MFPLAENEALVSVILIHFMISIRFLAMMTTSTIFMLPSFPNQVKFWVSVMLAVIVTPLVNVSVPQALLGSWAYVFIMTGREFLIGASIGLIAGLPAYAMQASGFMDGMLMGFNMMNMFDPLSATQTSVMSQIKYFIAVWFLMQWDGHILIVHALAESVNLLPPGLAMWPRGGVPWIDWIQRIFVIALKLSLPVFGAVLLADVGLGFVARTVPQMNVFILGIPLKITVGFLVLLGVLPSTVDIFHDEIEAAVEYALVGVYFWR